MIEIISYNPQYRSDFHQLNIDWLEAFFYVEPYDEEVLSNPETYIINKGGHIFFAKSSKGILGTFALMPTVDSSCFELTKMAVLPAYRGQKIGQQLLQFAIDFAKQQSYGSLLLYSNTKLENAIYLYRKFGFKELPVELNAPYKRGNIKMELIL